ncbi:hypothetical protein L6R52_40720, partial [Myxococcota bacterium]|nr:hypothetical protein [Myxococcota bacterium]
MSDEASNDGGQAELDGADLTADDCLRAGMYWFGEGDLAAAEAWWRQALALAPGHPEVEERLRVLARTVAAREAAHRLATAAR